MSSFMDDSYWALPAGAHSAVNGGAVEGETPIMRELSRNFSHQNRVFAAAK
jgi:hypothetical protein